MHIFKHIEAETRERIRTKMWNVFSSTAGHDKRRTVWFELYQNRNWILFTHLAHIQIFSLKHGPDVRQIPSTLVGNGTAQSLSRSVWPRLKNREERRGKKEGYVCLFCMFCYAIVIHEATIRIAMSVPTPWSSFSPPALTIALQSLWESEMLQGWHCENEPLKAT